MLWREDNLYAESLQTCGQITPCTIRNESLGVSSTQLAGE